MRAEDLPVPTWGSTEVNEDALGSKDKRDNEDVPDPFRKRDKIPRNSTEIPLYYGHLLNKSIFSSNDTNNKLQSRSVTASPPDRFSEIKPADDQQEQKTPSRPTGKQDPASSSTQPPAKSSPLFYGKWNNWEEVPIPTVLLEALGPEEIEHERERLKRLEKEQEKVLGRVEDGDGNGDRSPSTAGNSSRHTQETRPIGSGGVDSEADAGKKRVSEQGAMEVHEQRRNRAKLESDNAGKSAVVNDIAVAVERDAAIKPPVHLSEQSTASMPKPNPSAFGNPSMRPSPTNRSEVTPSNGIIPTTTATPTHRNEVTSQIPNRSKILAHDSVISSSMPSSRYHPPPPSPPPTSPLPPIPSSPSPPPTSPLSRSPPPLGLSSITPPRYPQEKPSYTYPPLQHTVPPSPSRDTPHMQSQSTTTPTNASSSPPSMPPPGRPSTSSARSQRTQRSQYAQYPQQQQNYGRFGGGSGSGVGGGFGEEDSMSMLSMAVQVEGSLVGGPGRMAVADGELGGRKSFSRERAGRPSQESVSILLVEGVSFCSVFISCL
ncbi:hypothetical protein HK102_002049 [Quaeritorhiza haematococci]|nr:hypothetical protein HK102_002049 [Quaeritorhiza haematococci]